MDVIVTPLALLLGLLSIFLILLHLFGKVGDKKINDIVRRLEAAEGTVANHDIKSRELTSEIEEIKKKNEAYVQLFKTVVHGFDYIVQGTKAALGIEGGTTPGEKVVSSGRPRQIP